MTSSKVLGIVIILAVNVALQYNIKILFSGGKGIIFGESLLNIYQFIM